MMGKLNVKSGVGNQRWKRAGDRRWEEERGLEWKKEGNDVFPFSVPFVEFPSRSSAAVSQPSAGRRVHYGTETLGNAFLTYTFPILYVLNGHWLLFRLKGNSAKL